MSRSPQACRRWKRRISLLAAAALEPPAVARTEAHLGSCPNCQARLAELQALDHQLRALGRQLSSVDPSPNLRRRWQAALSGAEVTSIEPAQRWFGGAWSDWIAAWLPGGPKSWPALAGCWVLIILLRFFSPGVAAPAASTPNPPLGQVLSILKTADSGQRLAPTRRGPEGASLTSGIEVVCRTLWSGSSPQLLLQTPSTTAPRTLSRTCKDAA